MILAVVAYALAVLAVGAASSRGNSRNTESFVAADRSLTPLTSWAALSSTTIGGSTTLVLAALVATRGLPALWLDLAGALGLLALGLFLAERVRRTKAVTISEAIGLHYGGRVRRLAAVLVVLSELVWLALLLEGTEIVVTTATRWPAVPVLAGTVAMFVVYTAMGGQRAVVRTDQLQLALMAAGILGISLPLALLSLSRTGPPPRNFLSFPFGPRFSAADAGAFLVLVGLPHLVGSDVWAKLLSARDGGAARSAALGASAVKLVFGGAVAVIALAAVARGDAGPPASIFPRAVLALAGPALAPLVLVALIATMQSSADSVLLSAAAATSHDLFGGRLGPSATRFLVVAYGVAGFLIAVWMRDLVETFRLGYTLFASSLILPTLAAMLRRDSVRPGWAGASMVSGAVASIVARVALPGVEPVLVGTMACALVLLPGLRSAGARVRS